MGRITRPRLRPLWRLPSRDDSSLALVIPSLFCFSLFTWAYCACVSLPSQDISAVSKSLMLGAAPKSVQLGLTGEIGAGDQSWRSSCWRFTLPR